MKTNARQIVERPIAASVQDCTDSVAVITDSDATPEEEKTYMPLQLKNIMVEHGITQAEMCSQVFLTTKNTRKAISVTTLNLILNWGTWPKTATKQEIKKQISNILILNSVPKKLIATAWELDPDDKSRLRNPLKNIPTPPADSIIPENEMLSAKAKKHFNIVRDPFIEDINSAEDVFLSHDQNYIRESMYQVAKQGGFLAVIGECGSGKSTLRRDLVDRISREELNITLIQPRIIDKARLTAGSICSAIISDVSSERPRQSLEDKARQIERLLMASSRTGTSHVLMIEEAHDISIQTLKYLKRFFELEDGYKKLLAIILIGQPELKISLDERQNPEAREVIRRCEIAELHPLDLNLEKYLAHKFKRQDINVTDIIEENAYLALRQRLTINGRGKQNGISMLYPLVVNNAVTKAMNMAAQIGMAKINEEIFKEV